MRPTVSHSWAHRNMMQKSPWMEYSGSTSYREHKQEEEEDESERRGVEKVPIDNKHFIN